jgi:hypothetical protein
MLEGVWCVFNDTQRTVTIRDNIIRTGPGYTDEGREVTILFEELFYNKQYQPFRVVCISRPLEGGSDRPSATISPSTSPPSLSSLCTFQQCCHYLHSWPENELVLKKVLERTREFNQCYEIVPGFEQCVVDKVRTMCKDAVEALLCANKTFRKAQNNPSQLRDLSLVIETYFENVPSFSHFLFIHTVKFVCSFGHSLPCKHSHDRTQAAVCFTSLSHHYAMSFHMLLIILSFLKLSFLLSFLFPCQICFGPYLRQTLFRIVSSISK